MKTIETTLYSFAELSEDAQKAVIRREADRANADYVGEEMRASLKAVAAACSVRLTDWSFGPYDRNWKCRISGFNADLEGNKALAYFLRVLISHGYARPKRFRDMTFSGVCGFTGVCYDEHACETIWRNLLRGETFSKAFDAVAEKFCQLWEVEEEYAASRECILDHLAQSAEIYTEEGEEF